MDCWPPVQWVPESSLMIGSRPSHIYFVFCFLDLDFVCSMPSTGFLRLYILSVSLLSVFSFWGIIPHPHYRSLSLFFSLLQDVSLKAFLSYPTRTRELNLNKTCMYIKKFFLINGAFIEDNLESTKKIIYYSTTQKLVLLPFCFMHFHRVCVHVHRLYQLYLNECFPKSGADTIDGMWGNCRKHVSEHL